MSRPSRSPLDFHIWKLDNRELHASCGVSFTVSARRRQSRCASAQAQAATLTCVRRFQAVVCQYRRRRRWRSTSPDAPTRLPQSCLPSQFTQWKNRYALQQLLLPLRRGNSPSEKRPSIFQVQLFACRWEPRFINTLLALTMLLCASAWDRCHASRDRNKLLYQFGDMHWWCDAFDDCFFPAREESIGRLETSHNSREKKPMLRSLFTKARDIIVCPVYHH